MVRSHPVIAIVDEEVAKFPGACIAYVVSSCVGVLDVDYVLCCSCFYFATSNMFYSIAKILAI